MAAQVNAGELRHRIRIVERNTDRDKDGYEVKRDDPAYWKPVRSCWAKFARQSGTETLKSGADLATVRARFLIRWTHTPLHRKMVILFEGKEWEIEYINDYANRSFVEIWAHWRSGKDGAADDSQ